MFPLSSKLRCPHGNAKDTYGAEAVTEVHLIKMVVGRKIVLKEVGERMGVSYRQGKRIGRAIRERRGKELVRGNRRQPLKCRMHDSLREKTLALSREVYWDFNDSHFIEKLRECEGLEVSRNPLRALGHKRRAKDVSRYNRFYIALTSQTQVLQIHFTDRLLSFNSATDSKKKSQRR
jgi:hypothetical protein